MARIIDVIEVANQQRDEMVRRLPEYGAGDFRFGSQVIVREYQTAVFFGTASRTTPLAPAATPSPAWVDAARCGSPFGVLTVCGSDLPVTGWVGASRVVRLNFGGSPR
jgi:hypothetical protein